MVSFLQQTLFKQEVIKLHFAGSKLSEAFNKSAEGVNAIGAKHAFMHLNIAHTEGGEIVAPLRELSDALQLQYQEGVNENIAKLPVKATMPLLVMFAGVIICFVTIPLVQIADLAVKAKDSKFSESNNVNAVEIKR